MFQAVQRHRNETKGAYAIPTTDHRYAMWSSTSAQLDLVSTFFENTAVLLNDRSNNTMVKTSEAGKVEIMELRDQLRTLSDMVFWTYSERIEHLKSCAQVTYGFAGS